MITKLLKQKLIDPRSCLSYDKRFKQNPFKVPRADQSDRNVSAFTSNPEASSSELVPIKPFEVVNFIETSLTIRL